MSISAGPPIRTPQSDALLVPLCQAIEDALEAQERSPKRRRQPLQRQLRRCQDLLRLTKSFTWLMDRCDEIQNPPPDYYRPYYDDPRAELIRRYDIIFAETDAEYARKAAEAAQAEQTG